MMSAPIRLPLVLVALLVGRTAVVGAQTAEGLASACAGKGGDPGLCTLAAAAGRDLLAYTALLAGPGSEVPGESSALGRRLGGMPRLAPSVRVSGLSVLVPDLALGAGESSFFVPALHAGLGLGLFDGFRLLPTVGGFLSFDVVGQASFMFFPKEHGFDGRADALTFGARVGILRESFTLPGVSVSVTRRLSGALRLGDTAAGDPAQVEVDPAVTSVRATVGKDLFAFGVLAGIGWDDLSSDSSVRATEGGSVAALASGSLEANRRTYFVGLSKQIGVLSWISVEVGWVAGLDAVSYGGTISPVADRTVYGSLALLLKL